jgi:Ulp1 family protease
MNKILELLQLQQNRTNVDQGIIAAQYTRKHMMPFPRQMNGYDCGVFLCMGADCIGLGIDFEFDQSIMERC